MLYLLDQDYIPGTGVSDAWSVLSDIVSKSGITLGTSVIGFQTTLTAVDMSGIAAGSTYRTVVGWLAALCGRNAVISRTGTLEFVWYTASGVTLQQQDCYDGMDQVQDGNRVFSMLAVTVTDEEGETQTLTPANGAGSSGAIENPYMTQGRLDAIWTDIGGLTYRPADLTFLGDLRLDAGDLITYTLSDGTTCTVPVMSLIHTFDGGVTTQIVSAGLSETAAEVSGGGTLTGKVKQLTADIALLNALTVTDNNGTTKINGGRIDTDSLFAQNITARGTINGLKLRGGDISIDGSHRYGNLYSNGKLTGGVLKDGINEYFRFDLTAYSNYADSHIQRTLSSIDVNGYGGISLYSDGEDGWIVLEAPSMILASSTPMEILTPSIVNTYTSFDGGVASEGSVTVVKKMGWCLVHGSVKLTNTVSDMTNVLDSSKVPAPQTGVGIYTTAAYWASSYTRNMRVGVGAGGSLRIQYGGAGTYTFSITYPIA